jgi:LacI family transcriptional regulator
MKPRMKDIARDLGISPMAVSKALRGHQDISVETRRRVLERAEQLNYRIDWIARSMVTGRTYLVGMIVPDLMQSFFAEVVTAATRALAPTGYHLLIAHSNEDAAAERDNIALLESRKVDGLIIATAERSASAFASFSTPYVLIDRTLPGLDANAVWTSDEAIGRIATEHLIEQGCRRIAHLKGPALPSSEARLAGYRATVERSGAPHDPDLIVEAGHDDASGYRAMRRLLAQAVRPDGLVCFNDPVAIGAIRALLEAGLEVPEDVAVIGAGNMHYSDMLTVPLSTVDQGTQAIGEEAAKLLLELIDEADKTPRRIELAPRLVVRRSSLRKG